VLAAPSSPMLVSVSAVVPRLDPGVPAGVAWEGEVAGLLARLAAVPDPRSPQGLRYRLSTLLGIVVCAMTGSGHDSLVSV
jgi:DDE_Tnp_1-associated